MVYVRRRSEEIQEYVSSILRAYLEHNGNKPVGLGVVDLESIGWEQKNVEQIGHPKEGVKYVKDGNEHQA